MKVGVYDPYLDTLGGGERYILDIGRCLEKENSVELFWNDDSIKNKIQTFLDISLLTTSIRPLPSSFQRLSYFKNLDLFFYVTDGSLFLYTGKKGFLIIQSPSHIPSLSLIDKAKLTRWQTILCYSDFMKQIIEKKLGIQATVLAPAVDTSKFVPGKKEKIILSVGRFFKHLHSKKQDVLINAFTQMVREQTINDWKLILVGSVKEEDSEYVDELRAMAKGYPVEIVTNASFESIQKYYSSSSFFWHATGFGKDLDKNPEYAEHFGMVTVEAMAAQSIPVVFAGGGQKEIVEEGVNGFLFETIDELKEKTLTIMKNSEIRKKILPALTARAKDFNEETFERALYEIIQK